MQQMETLFNFRIVDSSSILLVILRALVSKMLGNGILIFYELPRSKTNRMSKSFVVNCIKMRM